MLTDRVLPCVKQRAHGQAPVPVTLSEGGARFLGYRSGDADQTTLDGLAIVGRKLLLVQAGIKGSSSDLGTFVNTVMSTIRSAPPSMAETLAQTQFHNLQFSLPGSAVSQIEKRPPNAEVFKVELSDGFWLEMAQGDTTSKTLSHSERVNKADQLFDSKVGMQKPNSGETRFDLRTPSGFVDATSAMLTSRIALPGSDTSTWTAFGSPFKLSRITWFRRKSRNCCG